MQNKILQERREAFLQEIVNEALGSLGDSLLNTLEVTKVQCSKGKHDAKVFIESSSIDKAMQNKILQAFKKARPIIQEYILSATSWHTAPKITLVFDESLQIQNNLDKIFAQINAKSSNNENKE
ncbi:MAG: 30S ribosome-binding factor RbfA [Helicobacter sp.]|uniref:Ribosome-binding factor A n=3 Tax=Helicobacter bilis TaxID=37372 RepID=C3XJ53_9HELI|nr:MULTISPECIES: 30S ribosome-binding factor RbfA [Helicobacter]AQQ58985.1 ribosome-binding factor A [Helicobacter bilis]EEO25042.1 ribosome-binding factor A [Helicobacter bilis ATCC 43879]EMZ36865.1 ribosome-binding factor A [Helicobacter bilis WiWa]MCI7410956.1 30S ribosome-binding factor RbfA [Helicobacter bilis]MDD7295763.1 30S ribosome-binding factor RbfA [Helicobacter bilis]